jgi:hypothetical protein
MPTTQSMAKARKAVRDAQARAQEERAQRDHENVEDAAAFLVSRSKLLAVDEWEADRIAHIGAEAGRRREEHRSAAAEALDRIRRRGETITAIAALAQTTKGEVRSYLKLATAPNDYGDAETAATDAQGSSVEPAQASADDVTGAPSDAGENA